TTLFRSVLTVYNMLGQKVAMLVDSPLVVGQYRVTFDAGGLSTGVYYYRLEAGGQVRTQKMILLK
ncbi:MAG: T9SS type A sorting domain-containing protein, partial [Rhodothermales bacterium]